MQNFRLKRILRIFSANHWNQPESQLQPYKLISSVNFFLKCGKIAEKHIFSPLKQLYISIIAIKSNGFTILFPFIPTPSKIQN
jgi:hypothetical protein